MSLYFQVAHSGGFAELEAIDGHSAEIRVRNYHIPCPGSIPFLSEAT